MSICTQIQMRAHAHTSYATHTETLVHADAPCDVGDPQKWHLSTDEKRELNESMG